MDDDSGGSVTSVGDAESILPVLNGRLDKESNDDSSYAHSISSGSSEPVGVYMAGPLDNTAGNQNTDRSGV